ncbi:multidrug resistance-associated protein 1-like [Argopecten irradians]|uniref:multidrug resistance-associated protein 1-like n=1 Tax=Argopecten irradians TaxID=31199 RepID=UPI0037215AA9
MLAVRMVVAAGKLHQKMLLTIMRCPMTFFDTTPIGRIINRFSSDVDIMDNNLPITCRISLNTFFLSLSTVIVVSVNTPQFLIIIVPVAVLYFIILKFYIPTSRQLKRLESMTRSPVYNHFSESVSGASVIRAYRAQDRFIKESMDRVDQNLVFYYAYFVSARWLGVRLELLGNLLILAAALFGVFSPGQSGAVVGLSISYALQATSVLNVLVINISDLQSNTVSVERIKEYSEVQSEAEWHCKNPPPPGWPRQGEIIFQDYKMRYRHDLDLVLKGISVNIRHGEKIGIVGRTGAGKSSLTLSLFRLIEGTGGSIIIDGVRIADIGLHNLRDKLTILPQDPVLFSGPLRMNLDPFDQYNDDQLWTALQQAHLSEFIKTLPGMLSYQCGEGGQNFSVGQRQLVCLARTLLKKTNVLILDEATAAVDMQTDALIQETIHNEFYDCTVLSIAHRLNTVLDYDKVMVLSNGQIAEFDSPAKLLSNQDSVFYGMAADAKLVNNFQNGGSKES